MFSSRRAVSALLSIPVLLSCSVKEDREDCPSYLGLDLTSVEAPVLDSLGFDTLDIHLSDSKSTSNVVHTYRLDGIPDLVWLPVSKGEAGFMVVCGNAGEYVCDDGVLIPEGEQSPLLYGYGKTIMASEETHRDTVILHRHSCIMEVRFMNPGNYMVEIEGGICGFDRQMNPVEGLFSCSSSTGWGDSLRICIPRQTDSSLMMRVSAGGRVSSYFRIGAYLERSGYDWNAPDLEDISLTVDYTSSVITFKLDKDAKRYGLSVAI